MAEQKATQHRLRATRLRLIRRKTSLLNNSLTLYQLLQEVDQSTFHLVEVDQSIFRLFKLMAKALVVDQFQFHRLVAQARVNST